MEDTKIIYYIDEEDTPYLVKLSAPSEKLTLGDFKAALNRPSYKFFFKSVDADFGIVKEEITDDSSTLPCFNGKVIAWLVTTDGSAQSENHSGGAGDASHYNSNSVCFKSGDHGHISAVDQTKGYVNGSVKKPSPAVDECDNCADATSVGSADHLPPLRNFQDYKQGSRLGKCSQRNQSVYDTSSSMLSSDLESTSFFDSEDESSRFSTATGTTLSSRYGRPRRLRRRRHLLPISRVSEDASSYSSMTDSTVSLNIVTVTLDMEAVSFLGISIVGQSNRAGDGGIYVGSIMHGGAVALDGRIEPGDMLLEVNGISFEDMSNDDAVRVLREEVQKQGQITLVVAKCWDPNPKGYFTLARQEPVRPIDPRAWVLHTNAMTGQDGHHAPNTSLLSMQTPSSTYPTGYSASGPVNFLPQPQLPLSPTASCSLAGCDPKPGGFRDIVAPLHPTNGFRLKDTTTPAVGFGSAAGIVVDQSAAFSVSPDQLSVETDLALVVRAMLSPDSGLDIRDRIWLKITIPNAVIGLELVDWLYSHVDGFVDRREVRRYASNLLKCGILKHTVNKATFSEQCYYVFNDLFSNEDHDSMSDNTTTQASLDEAHIPSLQGFHPPLFEHSYAYQPPSNGIQTGLGQQVPISQPILDPCTSYTNPSQQQHLLHPGSSGFSFQSALPYPHASSVGGNPPSDIIGRPPSDSNSRKPCLANKSGQTPVAMLPAGRSNSQLGSSSGSSSTSSSSSRSSRKLVVVRSSPSANPVLTKDGLSQINNIVHRAPFAVESDSGHSSTVHARQCLCLSARRGGNSKKILSSKRNEVHQQGENNLALKDMKMGTNSTDTSSLLNGQLAVGEVPLSSSHTEISGVVFSTAQSGDAFGAPKLLSSTAFDSSFKLLAPNYPLPPRPGAVSASNST